MSEPTLIKTERELLAILRRAVSERVASRTGANTEYHRRRDAAEREYAAAREEELRRFNGSHAAMRNEYEAICSEITHCFVEAYDARDSRFRERLNEITRRDEELRQRAAAEHREAIWEAHAVFEATKDKPRQEFEETQRRVTVYRAELDAIENDADRFLADCRQDRVRRRCFVDREAQPTETEGAQDLAGAVAASRAALATLVDLSSPKLFVGGRPLWILTASASLAALPSSALLAWPVGLGVGLAGGAVAGLAAGIGLYGLASRRVTASYGPIRQELANARSLAAQTIGEASAKRDHAAREIHRRFDRESRAADELLAKRLDSTQSDYDRKTQTVGQEHTESMDRLQCRRDEQLRAAHAKYPSRLSQMEAEHRDRLQRIQQRYEAQLEEAGRRCAATEAEMSDAWRSDMLRANSLRADVTDACQRLFPAWLDTLQSAAAADSTVPDEIRLGQFQVRLSDISLETLPDGELDDFESPAWRLPALLPFPGRGPLLIEAGEDGSAAAARLMETLSLRLLTTLPPGALRLTFIDPLARGRHFAALMHLADYDEALVGGRIWTEPHEIELRLAELTEQMDRVIQTHLRNQFEDIADYNRFAGPLAEPYRVLVVSGFPQNFSDVAARRLVTLATSGPRCGVFVILSVAQQQVLPREFEIDALDAAVRLQWREDKFHWTDPDFGNLTFSVDAPPPAEQLTAMLHAIGQRAQDAGNVEVPFDGVAPPAKEFWSSSSRDGIKAPLGRAGATRIQHLQLGEGTSQHVLVAGKTGSGKSSLLHALVTGLALRYSPDELQLYLVDFKKGVEFKPYAEHRLPHAQAVAIQSEREFGLSVLVRLDEELHRRGDRFRQEGVQDVAGFRAARPDEPLPRILLIVDEFQELFVEDDKLAQDAALLLDRLVRQGRAFGIHVLLGSQTLSGTYSLARSTLGQMAVRIALACSESDAHLILSDENTAARLLSRPGQAVYNDAGGLSEGNQPFQVAWLSDERRESHLRQINRLANERPPVLETELIVFEGHVPADLKNNRFLAAVIDTDASLAPLVGIRAWLGDAVAIKEPSAAVFQRHAGSNLLLIGQCETAALGVMSATLVSLRVQWSETKMAGSARPRCYVLDGAPGDCESHGYLDSLARRISQSTRILGRRDLAAGLDELHAQLQMRLEFPDALAPPLFLLIHGLQHFRDLRKRDDDFSFSPASPGMQTGPAGQFAAIVRDGPAVGIHTVTWCDSLNNLNRTLDRQLLREFDERVLFQMSPADSSQLIDTPEAARLGPQRALYYAEADGHLEKFRPYGPPSSEWLSELRKRLAARPAAENVDARA